MFWGCFTYNKKGPCHIWEKETAQEKRERKEDLEARNREKEPKDRAKWERKEKEKYNVFVRKYSRRPGGRRAV
jgi:hypothetical protein